jgi:hypothetical protein
MKMKNSIGVYVGDLIWEDEQYKLFDDWNESGHEVWVPKSLMRPGKHRDEIVVPEWLFDQIEEDLMS